MDHHRKHSIKFNYVAPLVLGNINQSRNENGLSFCFDTDSNSSPYQKFSFKTNDLQLVSQKTYHDGHLRRGSASLKDSNGLTFEEKSYQKQAKLIEQKKQLSEKQIKEGTYKIFLLALLIPLFLSALYAVLYVTARKRVALSNFKSQPVQPVNLYLQKGIIQEQNTQINNQRISYIQPSIIPTPLDTSTTAIDSLQNFVDAVPLKNELNISIPSLSPTTIARVEEQNGSILNILPQTTVQTYTTDNQVYKKTQNEREHLISHVMNLFQSQNK